LFALYPKICFNPLLHILPLHVWLVGWLTPCDKNVKKALNKCEHLQAEAEADAEGQVLEREGERETVGLTGGRERDR